VKFMSVIRGLSTKFFPVLLVALLLGLLRHDVVSYMVGAVIMLATGGGVYYLIHCAIARRRGKHTNKQRN
jgi:hypothetical protein